MQRCSICRQPISESCNWNQGRCPHRDPIVKIQPKDTSKGHFYVSMVKSGLRIIAGASIIAAGYAMTNGGWLIAGGALLIMAEFLGIVEEMV